MITKYMTEIEQLIRHVLNEEKIIMNEAAQQISKAIQNENIIYLFGSGHSHMLAEELFYRAGGLVPIYPILHEPLMIHNGAVNSSLLERKEGYAHNIMAEYNIHQGDILIVISTSGRNAVPIEVAEIGKKRGAYVITLTSVAYSNSQPSRHSSGNRLYEVADLVLDSHVPTGDALLTHPNIASPFAPSSTVIGATMLNAIVAEAIKDMVNEDFQPPIFLSGNIDGADEHNNKYVKKYRDRIDMLEK